MKKYRITFTENLNLIAVRNISAPLSRTVSFFNDSQMCVVTCNVKPSKTTDILICSSDKGIARIASIFKDEAKPCNAIAVRGGICRVVIASESALDSKIIGIIARYFDKNNISIERIVFSEKEILLFFPASEVCGCLNNFMTEFEIFLQSY